MQFYMRIEKFTNGVSVGKGTTCYDAINLRDALRKALEMLDRYPGSLHAEAPSVANEERITVGPVLS